MRSLIATSFILLASLSAPIAFAGYNGEANFTEAERSYHRDQIQVFSDVAANCLLSYQEEHLDFYSSHCRIVDGRQVCLSKYFGDRRYSKQRGAVRSDGKPLEFLGDALVAAGFPIEYMNEMENISCVGMTLTCLKEAFLATGQEPQWKKVLAFTKANGVGGTALQEALRNLGWIVYYWNPSPLHIIDQKNAEWDREEANWASKGYHAYRYNRVKTKGTYWYNTVDNSTDLVGFGSMEPTLLRQIPFWVGTAHTGYHVFPGTYSDVVEAHSVRPITAIDNLEFSKFSPMATGGGPRWTRTEKYRSGLIAIPPL